MHKRILLLVSTFTLAGCGIDTSGISSLTGDATSGAALYAANCQSCHGSSGTQAASVAKRSVDQAASTILVGEGREMPAFSGTLTNQQVADIIAYLKTK